MNAPAQNPRRCLAAPAATRSAGFPICRGAGFPSGGPQADGITGRLANPRCGKPGGLRHLCGSLLCGLGILGAASVNFGAEPPPPPVTVAETAESYTLANGPLTAQISKRTGSLSSLRYHDLEMLAGARSGGYWSHSAAASQMLTQITIDPKANDGARGEVAVKGISGGRPLGSGPGGSVVADIEIRYALGRGDSGIYTYAVFDHQPAYPATSVGEARFCAKLNDSVFDWMTVDAQRNQMACTASDWNHGTTLNMKEARRLNTGLYQGRVEHKYDYTAVQFDTPAYGWSSTKQHVGFWFVNPTIEYLSGGPTKVEFCVHRDATFGSSLNAPAPPCVLNYWRSSHYGGSSCVIQAGEAWTKVIGPFLIYCNTGPTPEALWKDALGAAARETQAWPYDWVQGVDYPRKAQRGSLSGRLILNDPMAPQARMSNVLVGLSAPESVTGEARRGPAAVDWQRDAKHYQFWVRADTEGRFAIPNIRPGSYTLHAIASGVLGEYSKTNVTIAAGQEAALGQLDWKPVRFGPQLWEIGIPDRTAAEFRHGDHYWQWGLYLKYPEEFPNDVNFIIGQSDWRRDWNYAQCPRPDRPNGTPWTVSFTLSEVPRGRAILRLALAGNSARHIDVSVNDHPAGSTGPLEDTAVIRRDGIQGVWIERAVAFDATLLAAGTNRLTLTLPPGNPYSGVEYDYLRLECGPGR